MHQGSFGFKVTCAVLLRVVSVPDREEEKIERGKRRKQKKMSPNFTTFRQSKN